LTNGCLWAVPGSHRSPTRSRFMRNPNGPGTIFDPPLHSVAPYVLDGAESLPVAAGSLIMLHGNLVHFSHDNKSTSSRHAYSLHIIESERCHYPSANWLQRTDGDPFPSFDYRPNQHLLSSLLNSAIPNLRPSQSNTK